MRLMEADVRFRLKPIPYMGVSGLSTFLVEGSQEYGMHIRSENAPLRLIGVRITFYMEDGQTKAHWQTFEREIVQKQLVQFPIAVRLPQVPISWRATLYYRDLTDLLDYETNFNEQGYVSEGDVVDRNEFFTKIIKWFSMKIINAHLGR